MAGNVGDWIKLTWEDEDGPNSVEGTVWSAEAKDEGYAEHVDYSYRCVDWSNVGRYVGPPTYSYTFVIDGRTYKFEHGQEFKMHFKREKGKGTMRVFGYTDADGDKLHLEDDNAIWVEDSDDEDAGACVWVANDKIGPLVYNLLNNIGTKVPEILEDSPVDDEDTCRAMMMFYAKRLTEIEEEKQESEGSLFDLAVTLRATFYGYSEGQAREYLNGNARAKAQALKWAKDIQNKVKGDLPATKTLTKEGAEHADKSVVWKGAGDRGYFRFKNGEWYFSMTREGPGTPYGSSIAPLVSYFFPMTEA